MSPKEKILQYTVYYKPVGNTGYEVSLPAFPEIVTYGRTLAEARNMAKDALSCHLMGLCKDKQTGNDRSKKEMAGRREKISVVLNPA